VIPDDNEMRRHLSAAKHQIFWPVCPPFKFIMPRTAAASMTRNGACSVYKATPNGNTTQRTDRSAGFTDS
jgi:hypothetical protein